MSSKGLDMHQVSVCLRNKTVSVLGLAKGTGKTAVLNHLLCRIADEGVLHMPAVTSAGFDGTVSAETAQSAGSEIIVPEGTLVATAAGLLPDCDFTAEVLASTGTSSPLGDIYIFRARSAGRAFLGGPSSGGTLAELKKQMFSLGADCLLIDGAAGRRSVGTADVSDAVILCTAPWTEMTQELSLQAAHLAIKLYSLPVFTAQENPVYFPGAVTDSRVRPLLRERKKLASSVLVMDDPAKILLSAQVFDELSQVAGGMTVRQRPELLAVCINPVSPNGERYDIRGFAAALAAQTDIPVRNILEE